VPWAKYRPVTCASSGADATWIDVAAPRVVLFINGRMSGDSSRATTDSDVHPRPDSHSWSSSRTSPSTASKSGKSFIW
jgi:hypothetical protein